jgi:HipA-like protein
MSPKHLGVWLDGVRVATLDVKKPWDLRCRYEAEVLASGYANRPLLSCSLPVTRQQSSATPWVRGLLPEGNHLLALSTRARVPTNYCADLLDLVFDQNQFRPYLARPSVRQSPHGAVAETSSNVGHVGQRIIQTTDLFRSFGRSIPVGSGCFSRPAHCRRCT